MIPFLGLQNLYSSVRLRSAPPKSPKSPEINTGPAGGVPADGSERPETAPGGPKNWPKTGPGLAPDGPSVSTLGAAARERGWLFLARRVPRQWWHAGGRRQAMAVAIYDRHSAAAQSLYTTAAGWPDGWRCLYLPHDVWTYLKICRRCGAQGPDGPPAPTMLAQIIDALKVAIIGTLIAAAIAVICAMCAAYVFHVYLNLRGGF